MRDDEKMFNLGVIMFVSVMCLIVFLQVAYRKQNNDIKNVRSAMESVQQEYEVAETRFSALLAADSLRNSVVGTLPKAETVSFSKTIHINDIPMVE